jgi:hypothetical protein
MDIAREGVCLHFNGIQNDKCDHGVNYRELVGGDDLGWGKRTPCFKKHGSQIKCESMEYPSKEAIEKYEKESAERQKFMLAAIALIQKETKVTPNISPVMDNSKTGSHGYIKCPACGSKLHYSIAGGNHHIWGRCEKGGCLSWMM